jgi:hypothetical protein
MRKSKPTSVMKAAVIRGPGKVTCDTVDDPVMVTNIT